MKRTRTHLAAALTLLCLLLLPSLASAQVKEPFKCSICHKTLIKGKMVHKPVGAGACLKCHEQFSENHPLGKGSIGFIVDKPKLCYVCHTNLIKKPKLHKPVAEGKCTACHEPHSGDYPKLLRASPPQLCFRCHPKDHFTGGAHNHPPVARGECLSCHDAHQADVPKLLRKPGSQLCFSCHDDKIFHGKSVHPPVAKGECLGCHEPHTSAYRKILKGDFPDVPYRPFSADAWPLCFICHKPELASEVTTDSATNFRNGTRNLHAVHVNKPVKGRNCKICHNPHASAQDRLINDRSPSFGTWNIPIIYKKTPTGGQCSVGCHKTFYYDRVNPVGPQMP